MTSRHVFTQRLKSGVIFSAPGNMLAMPEEGWGDDTPMNRSKRPKKKVKNRGLDQFSHWIAKVTPYDEPYDDIGSFTPEKDTRNSEYRPYSIPAYPEPLVRPTEAEIPEVTLCLPTLSVSLTATVDGTVAHTELVQKFRNPSDEIIDAAKHVFPLYDGAVITSFECTIGDERRVRGVVKPKVQARKEFEEAVRDKVAAPALLEEHTPEIFETSLGNIPANTTVEIKITYVQELKVVMMETEATEGIALTIPMSIAPRYSKSPIEWEPASRVPEEKLDIWIKVIDNGKVNHEGCDEESGHLLKFEGAKPVEYSNLLEKDASTRTYYVWHHESEPPVLRKDFVFVIQMNEGHQIKSRAIACPADDKGLAAMRVNIRPNNLFRNAIIPQSFTGEILFLLDQSGSMGWSNGSPGYGRRRTGGRKIDVMREAMLLALSGIPSTCIFNIISWGSATVGLWENSQPHTQENIREAKSYVSRMEANMDGTDLLRALEAVVKRRVQERESTQIIILTDGELEPEDSIHTTTAGAKKKTYELPIETSSGSDGTIHRLVAKSVLLDLQDSIKRGTTETEVAKGNAESIGTMYSITSKWTSFVAVSENQPNQTVEEQKMNHYKALFDEIDIDELLNNVDDESSITSERLERTRAETTDGSVSDLLLLTEEDAVAGELIAVTSKPSGDESHGQAAATLRAQGSRPQKSPQSASPSRRPSADENGRVLEPANSTPSPEFYAPPVFSGHIPRPKSIVVSERLSEKVHRRKEFAQAEVADEPMVAPSANHGFAIPAAMIKPEEPQASDDSDTSSSDGLARERSMVTNVDSEVFILGGRQRFDRLSKPDMPRPVASPSGRPSVDERGKAPSSQASSQSDYDSDYDIKSLGSRDSASPQPEIHGPLDWQFAMECQDETATKISPKICELLHNSSIPEQERDDISARLLDTLMMIECYKTHRAQEEDTWDLMMERAWDAVISVLGLSDEEEELEELAGQLRGAMMHAHYIAATGVTGSETDGHTVNTVRCPTCNVVWRTTRQFWCPFDHDYDNEVDEILNWDDFWKHQVSQGHVVCTQHVMY
ncbi:von Willebrand factor A domain-containing protein 5A [Fusarium odoratissimum]|uniref:von Willebrand factor A domain-containing protein 5A n=1 Tax=Fusarium oxysporum f. sp. cubense (strain race 4) TaxID=2502994 RepID=N1RQX6_FUSC4|nr:von Willebrand factor A domain-containing protein 5A [Fusarium odoratissimum]